MNLLDADSYKLSHYAQYPPNTIRMLCYQEARVDKKYEYINWFGLQYYLQSRLTTPITVNDVNRAEKKWTKHGVPFLRDGFMKIITKHGGFLPVTIRSVDEGMRMPRGKTLLTVESNDEELFWLPGFIETQISRMWYPTSVCTISYRIKDLIAGYLLDTAGQIESLLYKLHDFGSRGASSEESAAIGGAAHLVNFLGTDNGAALEFCDDYYDEEVAGFSIPAMEHSTVTSWTQAREVDAYRNMLRTFGKPGKTIACVSDSYDIYNACDQLWGRELKDEVIKSGAVVVIRPDSGDPVEVVMACLSILADRYGYTTPYKGYKLLNNVRLLQGDGVNQFTIEQILKTMKNCGYSAENIAFGMGGALLQSVTRDTFSFAYKCCEITRRERIQKFDSRALTMFCTEDRHIPVFKKPKDDMLKASYQGYVDTAQYPDGEIISLNRRVDGWKLPSIMKTRYQNGELINTTTLKEIRSFQ